MVIGVQDMLSVEEVSGLAGVLLLLLRCQRGLSISMKWSLRGQLEEYVQIPSAAVYRSVCLPRF